VTRETMFLNKNAPKKLGPNQYYTSQNTKSHVNQ